MEIRRADLKDVARVRDLRLRALETDPDAFGETLQRALARPEADYATWIGSPENGMFVATEDFKRRDRRKPIAKNLPVDRNQIKRPGELCKLLCVGKITGHGGHLKR